MLPAIPRLSTRWTGLRAGLGRLARSVPARCAICQRWPAQVLCDTCVADLAAPRPRCLTCALPVTGHLPHCPDCQYHPPPLDSCHAAVDYVWPWAGLIGQFKFQQHPGWAQPLAQLLHSMPGVEGALARADRLLPMPLSRQRLAERGYNQALLLARHLAPDKTDAHSLLRLRHTPAQSSLSRDARLRNLQGALALDPLRAPALRGLHVLLVDDVMTTGASLHAAARVLRQAGVAQVGAVVLARTP